MKRALFILTTFLLSFIISVNNGYSADRFLGVLAEQGYTDQRIPSDYLNVNMKLGSLAFSTTDLHLIGRNGMDFNLYRTYTSYVRTVGYSTDTSFQSGNFIDSSYCGADWWLNFGKFNFIDTSVDYGNGSEEMLYRDIGAPAYFKNGTGQIYHAYYSVQDTIRYVYCYLPNGVKETYSFFYKGIPFSKWGSYKTKIEDATGENYLIYNYSESVPLVTSIEDAAGKEVWFEYTYTDTAHLEETRLIKIKYLNQDNDMLAINYIYDDSLDTLYDGNPLVMVAYPGGDTTRYAYTDSAYSVYHSEWRDCEHPRLSQITFPDTTCKINYDWKIYREPRYMSPTLTRYYWHVGVGSIRITNGASIDTVKYHFDYGTSAVSDIYSHAIFPDSSSKIYNYTDIYPTEIDDDEQYSGLLTHYFLFDHFPGQDSVNSKRFAYCNRVGLLGYYQFGYTTEAISKTRTWLSDTLVTQPFLYYYDEFYNGVFDSLDVTYAPLKYIYHPVTSFDSLTGRFHEVQSHNHKSYHSWTRDNQFKIIQDTIRTIGCYNSDCDTTTTYFKWNTDDMKIDTTIVTSGGESRTTAFFYDEYGNDTLIVKPFADTLETTKIEFDDSIHTFPIKRSNDYFDEFKASYHSNTGLPIWISDPNDDTTFYFYDETDRLTRIIWPMENDTSRYTYYNDQNRTVVDSIKLESNKYRISTTYTDGFGQPYKRVIRAEENDSILTLRKFDFLGRTTSLSQPFGPNSDTLWKNYEYNVLGKITKITLPDSSYVESYDSSSGIYLYTTIIDQMGRKTKTIIDTTLQLQKVLSDLNFADTLKYTYGPFGRIATITDPRGLTAEITYDNWGRVASDSSADKGKNEYYYDSMGRLRFNRTGEGDWLYNKYDLSGRIIETGYTESDTNVAHVDSMIYPCADTTILAFYKYDSYTYTPQGSNPVGRLTEVHDESGSTVLVHDNRGRVTHKKITIDGLTDTLDIYYSYGAGNQLDQLTYPDSSQISYEIYNSGRIRAIDGFYNGSGASGDIGFEYEPWGGMSKMIHNDTSFTTSISYNNLNLTTEIFNRTDTLKNWGRSYSYNNACMLDLVRNLDNDGDPTADTLRTYDYDYLYRLTEANIDSSIAIRYGYDQSGNRTHKVVDDGSVDSTHYHLYYDSLVTYDFTPYDTVKLTIEGSGGSDSDYHDPNATDSVVWSCFFGPDNYGSYFRIVQDGDTLVNVNSDDNGRFALSSSERVYVYLNTRCSKKGEGCYSSGTVTFYQRNTNIDYSNHTNQISHLSGQSGGNYEWDDNGCLTKDTESDIEYFFNEINQLDSVLVDDVKRFEFAYNAKGQRVRKVFYTGISCDSSEVTETAPLSVCYHEGDCMYLPGDVNNDTLVIQSDVTYLINYFRGLNTIDYPKFRGDVNCDGQVIGSDVTYLVGYFADTTGIEFPLECCYWIDSDTITTYYVYSGNQVIAEYDGDGNLIDNYVYMGKKRVARFNDSRKEYYVYDKRGSVVAILDTTGQVFSAYNDYYPFGSVLQKSGDSHLKYTGKEFDEGYGFDLYYYGARYYNPEWGRFISRDPKWVYYNRYTYCRNNPVNYHDPDGRGPVLDNWNEFGGLSFFQKMAFEDGEKFKGGQGPQGSDEEVIEYATRGDYLAGFSFYNGCASGGVILLWGAAIGIEFAGEIGEILWVAKSVKTGVQVDFREIYGRVLKKKNTARIAKGELPLPWIGLNETALIMSGKIKNLPNAPPDRDPATRGWGIKPLWLALLEADLNAGLVGTDEPDEPPDGNGNGTGEGTGGDDPTIPGISRPGIVVDLEQATRDALDFYINWPHGFPYPPSFIDEDDNDGP
ncbi:MAG: hypothetical protein GY839_07765 [candidate division Zixibacteria bacterium]|nr:hypothetical protein [candidate division Zixibacteria bacterium]